MFKYRNLIVYRILSRVLVLHRNSAGSMASSLTLLRRINPIQKGFVGYSSISWSIWFELKFYNHTD